MVKKKRFKLKAEEEKKGKRGFAVSPLSLFRREKFKAKPKEKNLASPRLSGKIRQIDTK